MSSLLHGALGLHGLTAYVVVGALCFGEASFFLGFVLPGETAVVWGGGGRLLPARWAPPDDGDSRHLRGGGGLGRL